VSEQSAEATTLAERRQQLAEQREQRLNPDAAGGDGAGGTGMSRKMGPLPVWAWIGIIAVGAALAWYVWKQRQSSTSTASSSSPSSSGLCLDATGQNVPCSQVDYGGQVATLQSEIMDLQGQGTQANPIQVNGTVQGLRVMSSSPTTVQLAWTPTPAATGYAVRQVSPATGSSQATVQDSNYIFSGLKPGTTYTFWVTAEPASTGHAAITVTTPKS
jgi:hypothetical protein